MRAFLWNLFHDDLGWRAWVVAALPLACIGLIVWFMVMAAAAIR